MLTYRYTDTFMVIGFSDSNYVDYVDDKNAYFWLYLYDG